MTELPRAPYNAGKPAGDELDIDSISSRVGVSSAWLKDHIEEFAAAYLKHTNLPPDQARMFVETHFEGLVIKYVVWFENKAEETERDAPLLARVQAAEAKGEALCKALEALLTACERAADAGNLDNSLLDEARAAWGAWVMPAAPGGEG